MTDIGLTVDRSRVSVRLRALLYAAIRKSGVRAVAADLQVGPESLQTSIDLHAPHPSIEVLMAVIRRHGVDPTWLLTGDYDLATHREALEDPSSASRLLSRTSLRRERSLGLYADEIDSVAEVSDVRDSQNRRRRSRIQFDPGDRRAPW